MPDKEHFQGVIDDMDTVVRRLTPLECERLQGFPDGWTNIGEWVDSKGKTHKDADSPRYKALGNSIALPFWEWLAKRITAQYDRPTKMASLFSGIGGFELAFARAGCDPIWASEIESFPIAVTKIRFPEVKEMAEPCHTCKHYNDGNGDADCLFCDPDFEDRWERMDTTPERSYNDTKKSTDTE